MAAAPIVSQSPQRGDASTPSATPSAVVLDHVSKAFHESGKASVTAAREVTLTLGAGELLVLTGPSGCGKSSLLRLIAGLEKPDVGDIYLNGVCANHLPPQDRDVALVFQTGALYPHLTVCQNLELGLMLRKVPSAEIQRRVAEMAGMLELDAFMDRLPPAISGGERQRVALGRALIRQPKLLLLDEPLCSLDAPSRARMRLEISRLHARLGTAMIYVTHDQSEAMTLGDRVAIMREGALEQVAAPEVICHHPANSFVADFIGSLGMNLIHANRQSGKGVIQSG